MSIQTMPTQYVSEASHYCRAETGLVTSVLALAHNLMPALGIRVPDLARSTTITSVPVHVVAVLVALDAHAEELSVAPMLRHPRGRAAVEGPDPSGAVTDGDAVVGVGGRGDDVGLAAKLGDGLG